MDKTHSAGFLDPIEFLFNEHEIQKKFCDMMEEIADSLPNDVDRTKALEAARILKSDLPRHHRMEEIALFPLLVKYSSDDDNMAEIVARLKEEHIADEDFSEELIEVLENLGAGGDVENPNMVGYMLRGFFQNYRRHIMWENNVVLSLARRRLPPKALREMATIVARLREGVS